MHPNFDGSETFKLRLKSWIESLLNASRIAVSSRCQLVGFLDVTLACGVLELVAQPVEPLVQTVSGGGACSLGQGV